MTTLELLQGLCPQMDIVNIIIDYKTTSENALIKRVETNQEYIKEYQQILEDNDRHIEAHVGYIGEYQQMIEVIHDNPQMIETAEQHIEQFKQFIERYENTFVRLQPMIVAYQQNTEQIKTENPYLFQ